MTNTFDPETPMPIILDGTSLTCAHLIEAAARKRQVALAEGADLRIRQGRAVVEEIVSSGVKGSGITTGVGSQKEFAVPPEGMRDYNRRLARAHSTHMGGAVLPERRVRAALIIRANEFSLGLSGVSAPLVQLIMTQFNSGAVLCGDDHAGIADRPRRTGGLFH